MTRKNDFISLGFCLALSAFMLAPLLTTATIHSFPANALPQEDAVKTEAKERVQKMYKDLDMSREQCMGCCLRLCGPVYGYQATSCRRR